MFRRPWFVILTLTATLLLLAPFASRLPDGLQRVAVDLQFEGRVATESVPDTPLAGYSLAAVRSPQLSKILAGLLGAAGVFLTLTATELLLRTGKIARKPGRNVE